MKMLTLYEKFVLIVQASTKKEALKVAGANVRLQKIIEYLECEYQFYQKKH